MSNDKNNAAPDPQPAELTEQQGVELPSLPDKVVLDKHLPTGICLYGYTSKQMQDYARTALAATGKQQVGEVQGDALLESLVARWRKDAEEAGTSDNTLCQKIANCTMRHAAELQAVIAARQPGAQELVGFVLYERADSLLLFNGSWETDERWFWSEREQAQLAADRLHESHGLPNNYWLVTPVSAAPPAQGIDLGQFTRLADAWVSAAERCTKGGKVQKAAILLMAVKELRDTVEQVGQRDAAPGVGNG